jgi:hypothetical protein
VQIAAARRAYAGREVWLSGRLKNKKEKGKGFCEPPMSASSSSAASAAAAAAAAPAGTADLRALKRELRAAARVLGERGLNVSARW